jgi:hypothetical protein
MSRLTRQPWMVMLVLLLLATAASVARNVSGAASPAVTVNAANPLIETTGAVNYKLDPDWPKLPPGRPEPTGLNRRMGYMHGDVAVSSAGEVYVSVQSMWRVNVLLNGRKVDADMGLPSEYADQYAGLQVYAPDGRYLRNVPNAPADLHGFIIHKGQDGEFIYGTRVAATNAPPDQTKADWYNQAVVKMTLAGKMVLTIPATAIPDQFKTRRPDGSLYLRLSGMAVAPNGELYVSDGYSSDYVHRFDRNGKYIATFGGKKEPYNFNTLHKLAFDTRFTPVRVIAVDRANNRVVHLSLQGDLLGVIAKDMMLPAALAIHGDYAAIAELGGQVTVLDKAGKVAAVFGTNTTADEKGNRMLEPAKWRPGIVTAPHGIAFNDRGDIFVSELNIFGRVHRFNRIALSAVRQD